VWTMTADQILDSITRYLRPTSKLPRRKLNAGLAGERLPRSGMVRISGYFRSL
jgi:hypothetical protein